jgi:hypothetical protein
MTERTLAWLLDNYLKRDPYDWIEDLLDSVASLTGAPQLLLATIAYDDGAETSLGTVPANSVIQAVYVARTTAWDALTTGRFLRESRRTWRLSRTRRP